MINNKLKKGINYYFEKEYIKTIQCLLPVAEMEHDSACYFIGLSYVKLVECCYDFKYAVNALNYLGKAIKKEFPNAKEERDFFRNYLKEKTNYKKDCYEHKANKCYEKDNYIDAKRYYKLAILYGSVDALFNMGIMYYNNCFKEDYWEAIGKASNYFEMAAAQGDCEAQVYIKQNDTLFRAGKCILEATIAAKADNNNGKSVVNKSTADLLKFSTTIENSSEDIEMLQKAASPVCFILPSIIPADDQEYYYKQQANASYYSKLLST